MKNEKKRLMTLTVHESFKSERSPVIVISLKVIVQIKRRTVGGEGKELKEKKKKKTFYTNDIKQKNYIKCKPVHISCRAFNSL